MNTSTKSEANKILIPIKPEDAAYIESVCLNLGFTFETFLVHLLGLYKESLIEEEKSKEFFNEMKTKRKKEK